MWYVYCLRSIKNQKLYVGYTSDLKNRYKNHNEGMGGSFTSKNLPWKLIYYEAYLNKKDAQDAERYYKTGFGRDAMKKKLHNLLKDQFGDRSA